MTSTISDYSSAGREVDEIPVSISFDIIRLFSEGLYKSPHKAIEELVSNGYDAGATHVHVLLPDPDDRAEANSSLWVIDDGHGMNAEGFRQLWRVADSPKADAGPYNGRLPIGQFGIGKLAAYVLAWHLVHLSRVDGCFLLTVMDFSSVTSRQADNPDPETVSLRQVDEDTARAILADVADRDPNAWDLLFGVDHVNRSWTVAGLSSFRNLYDQLSAGTLRWVLSTGLPLHSNFRIHLDGQRVPSSKERLPQIASVAIDENVPRIGSIKGEATIYETPLTKGKAAELSRSHGFFIRVRERVINLEDELFGIKQPNHAAWARFALEVRAEGLRDHLLSSREGVRDSVAVRHLRGRLLEIFNECRTAFEDWQRKHTDELDIFTLLSDEPSTYITEPLVRAVQTTLESVGDSFYVTNPKGAAEDDPAAWLVEFREDVESRPFDETVFHRDGHHAAPVRYEADTRMVKINRDHPFVDKLTNGGKNQAPAKLFAATEVLLEGVLQEHGVRVPAVAEVLRDRDRILRIMAGEAPPTAIEAIRLLRIANHDKDTLERATGAAFRVLGFDYEQKGGAQPGADGILIARLGRHGAPTRGIGDYRLVYDAKHSDKPSVPADKVDPASLEDFRDQEGAAFGFFIAHAYAAENDPESKINRKLASKGQQQRFRHLTLLKIAHLERLVRLHLNHGLTLTEIQTMFASCRTVSEIDRWIERTNEAMARNDVPLTILMMTLEDLKDDTKAVPSVKAARMVNPALREFEPERLTSRLAAVRTIIGERWLSVDDSGDVSMHQTGAQILAELERQIGQLDVQSGELDREVE